MTIFGEKFFPTFPLIIHIKYGNWIQRKDDTDFSGIWSESDHRKTEQIIE